jgi:hypothetical protein
MPGRTYAWRVRAKSISGISENSVFKNDGYSEIHHFTYTNQCFPPTFVLSEPVRTSVVKVQWKGHPTHRQYHVQYKQSKVPDAEWFEVYSYDPEVEISNLQAGKTYDFRVGGSCNTITDFKKSYNYSGINQFTMPLKKDLAQYTCGIVPEIKITNNKPLAVLGVNETFTAGDFPVTVKQIEGSNGRFSGAGYIVVPYLLNTKIAVVECLPLM